MSIYRVTNVPRLRSFQYRLMQCGITTNVQLEKWELFPTNLCYYCKKEKETLVHLFCECTEIRPIWYEIFMWLQGQYSVQQLNTSNEAIIFNQICNKGSVANFVCLLFKQYVYKQKCLKKVTHFTAFKEYVNHIQMWKNI